MRILSDSSVISCQNVGIIRILKSTCLMLIEEKQACSSTSEDVPLE